MMRCQVRNAAHSGPLNRLTAGRASRAAGSAVTSGTEPYCAPSGPLPDESRSDEAAPTPGERLFYALGQLYALWHRGQLDVAPADMDIEDLARIIGVWRDCEFVNEGPLGRSYHFPGEVLVVNTWVPFPWELIDVETWAGLAEQVERNT